MVRGHTQDFKQLKVWERAHSLVLEIYRATVDFPPREIYGLTAQLRRAASSIPTNIVEGTARGTDRDTVRFLWIALGSAAEVQYLLFLVRELGYLSQDQFATLDESTVEVKRMLSGFISHLRAGG